MDKKRKENILKFAGLLAFFGIHRSIELMRIIKNIDPINHDKSIHFEILEEKIDITIKDIKNALGVYLIREFRV